MRKITGQLLSSKPVSISRAAKLLTRFAAVDNGSSATVSLYLQRTADAFNQLVQFHSKHPKNSVVGISPNRERARKSETTPNGKTVEDSKNRGGKDKKTVNEAAEADPNEDGVRDLKREEKEEKKEKKKKKKMNSDDGDDDSKKKKKKRKSDGDEEKSKKKRTD
ncbi:hypothetical protein OROGR_001891 [Orobanche gracilis]